MTAPSGGSLWYDMICYMHLWCRFFLSPSLKDEMSLWVRNNCNFFGYGQIFGDILNTFLPLPHIPKVEVLKVRIPEKLGWERRNDKVFTVCVCVCGANTFEFQFLHLQLHVYLDFHSHILVILSPSNLGNLISLQRRRLFMQCSRHDIKKWDVQQEGSSRCHPTKSSAIYHISYNAEICCVLSIPIHISGF